MTGRAGGGGRTVSVSTVAWDGYGMEAALDGAVRAGASHVEPAFIDGYVDFTEADFGPGPARVLRDALRERGLRAGALSAHLNLSAPDAGDALRRRIDLAAEIGAPFVVTNAGPAAAEGAVRRTLDGVRRMAGGPLVLLENPGHGAGDLIPHAAAGAAFLERMDADPDLFGLNLDLGNVFTYSRGTVPLAGQIAAGGRWLRHLHLKDVRDTGAAGGSRRSGPVSCPMPRCSRSCRPDCPSGWRCRSGCGATAMPIPPAPPSPPRSGRWRPPSPRP